MHTCMPEMTSTQIREKKREKNARKALITGSSKESTKPALSKLCRTSSGNVVKS